MLVRSVMWISFSLQLSNIKINCDGLLCSPSRIQYLALDSMPVYDSVQKEENFKDGEDLLD